MKLILVRPIRSSGSCASRLRVRMQEEVFSFANKCSECFRQRSHGGQEAHLIADEIAAANLSVILSPPRAFPESWDERRAYGPFFYSPFLPSPSSLTPPLLSAHATQHPRPTSLPSQRTQHPTQCRSETRFRSTRRMAIDDFVMGSCLGLEELEW